MWLLYFLERSIYKKLFFYFLCLIFNFNFPLGSSKNLQSIITSLNFLTELNKKEIASIDSIRLDESAFLKQENDFKIEPHFMQSILLHTHQKYINLIKDNKCLFYSLLETNFLQFENGNIYDILLYFIDKHNQKKYIIVDKKIFLKKIYRTTCMNNQDIKILLKTHTREKTLSDLKVIFPKSSPECHNILNKWKNDPRFPYLCKILDPSNKSLKTIPVYKRIYFNNICSHFDNTEYFCSHYIGQDSWTQILNGELPSYYLNYKCKSFLNKKRDLNFKDLQKCTSLYKKNPEICIHRGGNNARRPYPTCDSISKTLQYAHLKTDYHDCPSLVDNESVINTTRIIDHFQSHIKKSSGINCADRSKSLFATLNINFNNEKGWPIKICYEDPSITEEICYPYIAGNDPDNPLSESSVVRKILIEKINAPLTTICKKIEKKFFNLSMVKFRIGCYIVYDDERCHSSSCLKKIFFNEVSLKGIRYTGNPYFYYFKTSSFNEKFSLVNILNETYQLKNIHIKNISDLNLFFKNHKTGILHGVGCLQDILYKSYFKKSLNMCTPIPFIIDGITPPSTQEQVLVLRLSIDDIHSPILITWSHIFSSLKSYQVLHPLKLWTLYGITKKN